MSTSILLVVATMMAVALWSSSSSSSSSPLVMAAAASKGRDFYKILGVPRDANEKQIKKAYFQLSKKVRVFGGDWCFAIVSSGM
jgi:preprotein translocase subunit Sec63